MVCGLDTSPSESPRDVRSEDVASISRSDLKEFREKSPKSFGSSESLNESISVTFVNEFEDVVDDSDPLRSTGVHCTAASIRLIATALMKALSSRKWVSFLASSKSLDHKLASSITSVFSSSLLYASLKKSTLSWMKKLSVSLASETSPIKVDEEHVVLLRHLFPMY
ncbi:hypothetical protein TNIN_470601 [Trichonephila inaurata madagascariensis]|uniref:Uncharacterized protein n=1 Tax=Trichonephila inaurata madagascariensis TaxID=2747483 RepID=A0A8X6YW17_9ARAC|nr:hypothetical protein TNIN_470601 [Trichonephila inaurata madagascariensis]